eukprot:1839909-Rhodomonas_salina.2
MTRLPLSRVDTLNRTRSHEQDDNLKDSVSALAAHARSAKVSTVRDSNPQPESPASLGALSWSLVLRANMHPSVLVPDSSCGWAEPAGGSRADGSGGGGADGDSRAERTRDRDYNGGEGGAESGHQTDQGGEERGGQHAPGNNTRGDPDARLGGGGGLRRPGGRGAAGGVAGERDPGNAATDRRDRQRGVECTDHAAPSQGSAPVDSSTHSPARATDTPLLTQPCRVCTALGRLQPAPPNPRARQRLASQRACPVCNPQYRSGVACSRSADRDVVPARRPDSARRSSNPTSRHANAAHHDTSADCETMHGSSKRRSPPEVERRVPVMNRKSAATQGMVRTSSASRGQTQSRRPILHAQLSRS